MSYPGNSDLSPDIRDRILTTFRQTLSLAGKGSQKEALLGCDFILRLDPLFEPARTLQRRIEAGDGAVSVADLQQYLPPEPAADAATGALEEGPSLAGLEGLDLGLGESPAPAAPGAGGLAAELADLLERREFQPLLDKADANKERIAADGELQALVKTAIDRHEAEPYVRSFLDSTKKALAKGNLDEARGLLKKAEELDGSHPEIATLGRQLGRPEAEPAVEESAAPSLDLDLGGAELIPPSEPTASLDSESEERITELLAEGQASFEQGQYQSAIDAWSRIFLIDIDHAEANRRIELARKLKAEVERKVEEAYHEGISRLEAGSLEEGREAFARVLEMQPNHLAAREYLQKIDSGELKPGQRAAPPPAPPPKPAPRPAAPPADDELVGELDLPDDADLLEIPEPEAAPDEAAAEPEKPARPPRRRPAKAAAPSKRTFAIVGAAVLLLVVVGGWLLFSKKDQIFPNSSLEPPATAGRPDPIARARDLHGEGKAAIAIAQLKRLPPNHPQYDEAQALIAQWETVQEPVEEGSAGGPDPAAVARGQALVAEARAALADGDNLAALDLLAEASAMAPDADGAADLRAAAEQNLAIVKSELALFRQGDWEYALPKLWRLREEHPESLDVERLIVDSYFNLGLRDLQRGDVTAAVDKLEEGLALAPDDGELERLTDFARTYRERPTDLLFRIFIKYHPFR